MTGFRSPFIIEYMRIRSIIILLTLLTVPCLSLAQTDSGLTYSESARVEAVKRGLKYLTASQKPNGSFGSGYYDGDAAVTALAGMAFISSGDVCETPDAPSSKCVKYLLSIARPDGFINRPATADADGSFRPMYGHGFATLFLAETAGMYQGDDLIPVLDRAIKLIIASQNDEGGWRYFPVKKDADVSVTACQVMALRAARNAGRDVPAETIDRAVKYLMARQNSDGGFMYMSPSGESALPRSAAVVAALYSAGQNDNPALEKSFDYLNGHLQKAFAQNDRRSPLPGFSEDYPYYAIYYLSGAYRQQQKDWQAWRNRIVPVLLAAQNPDGSWSSEFSKDYATAMALIVLQLENNYLPIWQK